ncbi:DUF3422 domain-containing protein [Undibacterium sp. LX40W]|uniref:DUF3422 domain-containing protein n=1 Tax=Undibacterium nitidum TaxID=2762298 RepID=A0A923HRC6_9BURK|nr:MULTISPECIES: DUF3422 domain-containing protein [Undibacterium]MBC3881062.1 DUF3422 domain-containing protein [Undibacterium nitidum]MBC3890205.1 DUF3422 domain-containing protein [Undibacterium sp. LX40W]
MSIQLFELNHPSRVQLAAEIHSRPFLNLQAPELLTHLAIYAAPAAETSLSAQQHQSQLLQELCTHFGVSAPSSEAKYFYFDFGQFRLKWECHTEFATYTFARHLDVLHSKDSEVEELFGQMPIQYVPEAWLYRLQGQVLVASHLLLLAKDTHSEQFAEQVQAVYRGNTLAASYVMHGAEFYSDFAIHADGYSRFLIRDIDMRSQQAGRLAQRILEIETYRMMALLGLPIAQDTTPQLNAIESSLVALANGMVEADRELSDMGLENETVSERVLLEQITHLAARIEKLSLHNSYRFAASKAYIRLVHARIEELREQRIEGMPMVVEFMERRLTPAMNTCEAVANRQEGLAQRIAHSNDLLRTRVGIVQEMQNRQILQSMNARAAQQLHLQQAVEGLSVAAISYYVIGLFSYVAKAAKEFGWIAHVESWIGLGVPVVLGLVWFGLRRMHSQVKNVTKDKGSHPSSSP